MLRNHLGWMRLCRSAVQFGGIITVKAREIIRNHLSQLRTKNAPGQKTYSSHGVFWWPIYMYSYMFLTVRAFVHCRSNTIHVYVEIEMGLQLNPLRSRLNTDAEMGRYPCTSARGLDSSLFLYSILLHSVLPHIIARLFLPLTPTQVV